VAQTPLQMDHSLATSCVSGNLLTSSLSIEELVKDVIDEIIAPHLPCVTNDVHMKLRKWIFKRTALPLLLSHIACETRDGAAITHERLEVIILDALRTSGFLV